MARRVEEIKRVRREISGNDDKTLTDNEPYEEEYYDVGETLPDQEAGLNTASGVLALVLLALAAYLIWAALR